MVVLILVTPLTITSIYFSLNSKLNPLNEDQCNKQRLIYLKKARAKIKKQQNNNNAKKLAWRNPIKSLKSKQKEGGANRREKEKRRKGDGIEWFSQSRLLIEFDSLFSLSLSWSPLSLSLLLSAFFSRSRIRTLSPLSSLPAGSVHRPISSLGHPNPE